LIVLIGLFISTSLPAGYRTTLLPSPDRPVSVICRAEGDCEAEDQLFFDDLIIKQA
jgi:hypothetical protein